jgi:multidrug efflux pump subunit AcrB
MKSFLIAWLVAFGLVAVIATGVSWFVARVPQPAPVGRTVRPADASEAETGPFSEADAVAVVARRLPSNASGNQLRRALEGSATVTYHSPRHWRVCYDGACWVAHGPGRYAEPENDAARRREARPALPR